MAAKQRPIEDRVAELERDVAALKAAGPQARRSDASPGFAEEGHPALISGECADQNPQRSIGERLSQLEAEVAELKAAGYKQAMLDRIGIFKDDPGYDEAMRLGAEWRRQENLKSIRELERRGEIDADPGHRSSQRPGSRRKAGKRAARET